MEHRQNVSSQQKTRKNEHLTKYRKKEGGINAPGASLKSHQTFFHSPERRMTNKVGEEINIQTHKLIIKSNETNIKPQGRRITEIKRKIRLSITDIRKKRRQ